MKKLLLSIASLFLAGPLMAFSTIQYVQISTNSNPAQTGQIGVSSITFSPTSAGIIGATDASAANVGVVGEFLINSGEVAAGTSGQYKNFAQLTLTAGDWDLEIHGQMETNSAVITGDSIVAISSATNNGTTDHVTPVNQVDIGRPFNATSDLGFAISRFRVSLSTTVIYYGKMLMTYSSGSAFANGTLTARRIR